MLIAWRFSISPITNFPETLMEIGIGLRSKANRLLTCSFVLCDTKIGGAIAPGGIFVFLSVKGRKLGWW